LIPFVTDTGGGGTQQMTIKGDSDSDSDVLTIPLDLAGCMLYFKHRLPTAEEIASLKQYCLTQGDVPGIRHHFLIKWRIHFTSKSLRRRITILA
jgi:hypothetical protein